MSFRCLLGSIVTLALAMWAGTAQAAVVWVEGERPTRSSMNRHPWWYDKVNHDQLSGGDCISNFHKGKVGEAEYLFVAPAAGSYAFWVRCNPVKSRLSYQLNDGPWVALDFGPQNVVDSTNIAEDGKPDLRFIAWVNAGDVKLKRGENAVRFRMDSENNNHGMLDCFVLANEPFAPNGITKPGAAPPPAGDAADGIPWLPFAPPADPFESRSGFDLRSLNEAVAGEGGFIAARDGRFVHSRTGQALRFWGVDGPPNDLNDMPALRRAARLLAKYGVNLVRVHGPLFDEGGNADPAKIRHVQNVIEAMRQEGIYTHVSLYFPLWMNPKPGTPWLQGYNGSTHPFAALFFNPDFQERHRSWLKALLTTPSPHTGKPLIEEPALAGVELVNEDSYFFWTFNDAVIPDAQLRMLEKSFGDYVATKHGSIDAALRAWGGSKLRRDDVAAGRLAFRPLYNMAAEKRPRDKDTVAFLLESQRGFYLQGVRYVRQLGFKGMVTCSNWATASPEVYGPLEAFSYTAGDFIDRHGYVACNHKGNEAAWSIRNGHTFSERSALRLDGEQPGKPKLIANPAMDVHYDHKPTMISEIAWNRPSRYRGEAPLFLAAYGALQGSDAIVHFAFDGVSWSVKPGFFMQPWTLLSPASAGQFPAAALIYRRGLVSEGDVLAALDLRVADLLDLKGTPMPLGAALDELRLKDVPQGTSLKAGDVIDPLVHFAGRTDVNFVTGAASTSLKDLSGLIDHRAQTVTSSNGELKLDYAAGLLTIDAPAAQGASGALDKGKTIELKDLSITSEMDLGHVIAVSLDGKPLATSERILLQVMSEERATGFRAEPVGDGTKRIVSIGTDPWQVRQIRGVVRFKRTDAANMKVTALDAGGYPVKESGDAREIQLQPATLYYLIAP